MIIKCNKPGTYISGLKKGLMSFGSQLLGEALLGRKVSLENVAENLVVGRKF